MSLNLDMLPGWRSPGNYALDSEQASASIGHNFGAAFNSAQSRKQDQSQFDDKKKMVEDKNAADLAAKQKAALDAKAFSETIAPIDSAAGMLDWSSKPENAALLANPINSKLYDNQLERLGKSATIEKNSIAGSIRINQSKGFNSSLQKLSEFGYAYPESGISEHVARISALPTNPNGDPSADQFSALHEANRKMKALQMAEMNRVKEEALARGDVPTTTIKDDGKVSTVFRPKKETKNAEDVEIRYDTPFPDMPWIKTAVTPGGTLHVIKGEAPMTVNQRARAVSTIGASEKKFKESEDPTEQTYLRAQINILKNALKPMDKREPIQTNSAPAEVSAPAFSVPTINSQADYDALPDGASYLDSTGKSAVKRKRSE